MQHQDAAVIVSARLIASYCNPGGASVGVSAWFVLFATLTVDKFPRPPSHIGYDIVD